MAKYRDSVLTKGSYRASPSSAALPAVQFPRGVTVIEGANELEFHWPDEESGGLHLEDVTQIASDRRPLTGVMLRREDQSGVSGTGVVADFAQFPSGRVVIEWRNDENENLQFTDTGIDIRPRMEVAVAIHGHGGRTEFIYDNGKVADH
ncbi:hypothetical protein [Natronosalvus rutilus]|uniref:Uncharacterized protein n=1 Tax=Natronosalvus rutilus TaxID=2953753 RepID=A0A9E7NEI0_9EURY|nr:hypothetical protein [Natronosalvus rutilus]UTF56011.1 hypothetical protein NGM29_20705 [Natronosalvus rutilus]